MNKAIRKANLGRKIAAKDRNRRAANTLAHIMVAKNRKKDEAKIFVEIGSINLSEFFSRI